MTESSFDTLFLVPARVLLADPTRVTDQEGVYYVFFEGGDDLLRAASYYDYNHREPHSYKNFFHLYTGASNKMRSQARRHLTGAADRTDLRRTLVALQLAREAITKTNTKNCTVTDRHGLDLWLAGSAQFAFIPCENTRARLRSGLRSIASPLNITGQRDPTFATQLRRWRAEFLRRDGSL